ncbi:amino acid permease/ SLC12A domain-containing protein [Clohesyomyces aquaticus]|uniref:Amino acid permease/ SLC12A domain-containing protein n=1 Tax=Clohesyomyces aquaticus TaxID=1231657 RepID=A0A1Y1YJ20_9PLEO|nr:amino acid permease/ SLC12A domain-containing protein [Clohesyomyces aquaticus]
MMSFSQCIGIGLFLQNGRTMFLAGPGLATLAYFLAGTVMWSSAACLGEMTALFPVKGPIFELPRRFLDESLGYAAGWITWFSWIVLIAAELVAITHIFQFKYPSEQLLADGYPDATLEWMPHISPTVIVMIFLVVLLLLNLLPVRHFGQMEYIFGVIKLCFIVTMIVLNTVLHSWDRAKRGHFWTYNTPYSFGSQNLTLPNGHVVEGVAGKLGGMWEAMLTCLFGMIGFETVAITAAENRDLRTEETVKLATRKISLRIITLYCLATFTVSLNVPYTHPLIQDHAVISFGYGQNSAFVISSVLNHLRVWPYFINCFIIFSASTAGANGIYNASRTLHALASIQDAWPQWGVVQAVRRRLERTYYGVPLGAVVFSWMFGLLGFLGSNASSARILGRMVRCVVVSMLIVYAVIALSFLEFYKTGDDEAIDDKDEPTTRQRYDRNCPQYPYRSHGQWLRALYAFVACSLFILFNGWRTFVSPMHTADFVACYVPILLFAVISMGYQIKLNGWNPLNWRRRASRELQNPPPQFATSSPRRGHIAFKDPENLFTGANLRALVRWIWVWMK